MLTQYGVPSLTVLCYREAFSNEGISGMLAVNSFLKDGEVQSGPSSEIIWRMDSGKGVGSLELFGLNLKNSGMLFLER